MDRSRQSSGIGWLISLTALALLAIPTLTTSPGDRALAESVDPLRLDATATGVETAKDASAAVANPVSPPGPLLPPPITPGLSLPAGSTLGIVPIDGLIRNFTLTSIERRVDRALAAGATVIVFRIDTNGGVLTSAISISQYIKGMTVPTIAWVNTRAISAGSLIAAACDELIMAPSSLIGDCAPISPLGSLATTERAKALSPLLAEFRDSAASNGRPYAVYQAMCVLNNEVYLLRHRETGQTKLVNQVDYRVLVDGQSPNDSDRLDLGDIDYDDPAQASRVGRASLRVGVEAERGKWEPVTTAGGKPLPLGRVHDGAGLLTMTADEAEAVGFSAATLGTVADVEAHYGAAGSVYEAETWAYGIASILTHPIARGVLILVMFVGVFVEAQFPGLLVPGITALLALLTLVVSPLLIGLAEWWHILVVLVGLLLIVVEVLLTPTFGFLGVVGVIAVLMGLALSVVPTGGSYQNPVVWDQVVQSTATVVLAAVAAIAALALLVGWTRRLPVFDHLVLQATASGGPPPMDTDRAGDQTGESGLMESPIAEQQGKPRVGVVVSALHPSGTVEICGVYHDAESVGEWIDVGTSVRVVGESMGQLRVDRA